MSRVSVTDVINAVADFITSVNNDISYFNDIQYLGSLKETITDTPTIQIYFTDGNSSDSTELAQKTFKQGVRQTRYNIVLDVFSKIRSEIHEDEVALLIAFDNVEYILEVADSNKKFNTSYIKGITWNGERITIPYNNEIYVGCRFTLGLWIF